MGPSAGYDGDPADQGRAGLVNELSSLVRDWEQALGAGPAATARLSERSATLEQRSRVVGFGGVGHHLAELRRMASGPGTPLDALRAQLDIVRELVEQARQALSPDELAGAAAPPAADGLAPPPLLTQFRRALEGGASAPGGAPGPASPPLANAPFGPPPLVSLGNVPLGAPASGNPASGSAPLGAPPSGSGSSAPPSFGGPPPLSGGVPSAPASLGGPPPLSGGVPPAPASLGGPPPLAPLSGNGGPPPLAPLAGSVPSAPASLGGPPPPAPLSGNGGPPPLAPLAGSVPSAPASLGGPPPLAPLSGNVPPASASLGGAPPLAPPAGNAPSPSAGVPPLAPLPLGPAPPPLGPPAAGGPLAPPPLAPLGPIAEPPRHGAELGLQPGPPEKQPFAASPPVVRNLTAAEGLGDRPATAAPKLLVRSMLGLRAFGRRGAAAPSPGNAQAAPAGPSLLGLKRGSGAMPATPPPPAGEGPGGLPPLVGGLPEAPQTGPAPPPRLDRILDKIEEARELRPSRASRAPSTRPRKSRRPDQPGTPWWVPALIAGGFLAAVGIIVGVTVVAARGDSEGTSDAIASGTPVASGSAAGTTGMPRQRLLHDEEQFQELLRQLHGRGKESPELAALLDEQASVTARAIGSAKCVGSAGECAALAEVREIVTGSTPMRVVRRRSSTAGEGWRSKWLAGLKLPGIPVEDDPRVQRRFEYYTQNSVGREVFQQMLWRCGEYSELIRAALIRRGLPEDLLAVVFAESGCQPLAKSPAGAEGLWQFIPAAARAYHLRVIEGVVDERHSPVKATEAAVHYLSDLYAKLGQWDLAMAGYNMGPFGLLARIQRAGGNVGFWDLVDSDLLPDETADYVPNIQAIALILANLSRLKFGGIQTKAPQLTADLQVPPGTRLSLVARAAAMSTAGLRQLNLDIKGDRTPLDIPGFVVQVPKDVVWRAGETLQELLRAGDNTDLCVPPTFDWGRQRFTPEMAATCQRRLAAAAQVSGSSANPE